VAVFKKEFVKKYNRKVWGFVGYIDGVRKRKFGFATEEKAQTAFYNARVAARERRAGVLPDDAPVTVKELIETRIKKLPVPKGSPGHHSRNQAIVDLNRFLALLPDKLLVTQLTTADIARYRDARLGAGLAPQTVFREITNIQACLNSARETFPQLDNWRPPARPKLKVPKGNRNRVIAPDEAAQILARLRRERESTHKRCKVEPLREYRARLDAADFFQFALQTAMRPDEIVRSEWSHVLWHTSRLLIDATKTDEEGTIDLPESCLEMLKRRREQNQDSHWIFPSDIKRGRHLVRAPAELIRRAAYELKIAWGYAEGGIVLYTTRHTAATAMLDAGHDIATVQAQTRHSTKTMLFRYAHATARSRRAAASSLDSFGSKSLAGSLAGSTPATPPNPRMPRHKGKVRNGKSSTKS
jgi:integrase